MPPLSVTTTRGAPHQRQEVEVAQRIDDREPRHVQEPGGRQRGPAPRMERQHDGQPLRERPGAPPRAARRRPACPRWPVDGASPPRRARPGPGARASAPGRTCPGAPAACRSWGCPRSGSARRSTPSRARLSSASGLVTNSRSDRTSVTRRLTSSGIVMSKLRSPASTWAIGMPRLGAHERRGERRVDVPVDDDQADAGRRRSRARPRARPAAPRSGPRASPSRRPGSRPAPAGRGPGRTRPTARRRSAGRCARVRCGTPQRADGAHHRRRLDEVRARTHDVDDRPSVGAGRLIACSVAHAAPRRRYSSRYSWPLRRQFRCSRTHASRPPGPAAHVAQGPRAVVPERPRGRRGRRV